MSLTPEELQHIKNVENDNKTLQKIIEGMEMIYGNMHEKTNDEVDVNKIVFQKFIKLLDDHEKEWFAHAIVGVVCADGKITPNEITYLKYLLAFIEDKAMLNRIMSFIQRKEKPKLEILKTSRTKASQLIMYLASVVITDDRLTREEVDYFRYVGSRLGFDPIFSTELIKWGQEFIKLNQLKNKLIKLSLDMTPVYKHV
ncbi:MAG: hypothetical protein HQM11_13875 [SAR324 cluster bacterium]|nr:hypothetical protein [SAR324 cluster bacterium]